MIQHATKVPVKPVKKRAQPQLLPIEVAAARALVLLVELSVEASLWHRMRIAAATAVVPAGIAAAKAVPGWQATS